MQSNGMKGNAWLGIDGKHKRKLSLSSLSPAPLDPFCATRVTSAPAGTSFGTAFLARKMSLVRLPNAAMTSIHDVNFTVQPTILTILPTQHERTTS